MIWISFGKWNHSAGNFFVRERIYLKGYKWTPFVRVQLRHYKMPLWEIRTKGHGASTSILYNGEEMHGVTRVQFDIRADSVAKLTLTVIPRNFVLTAEKLDVKLREHA